MKKTKIIVLILIVFTWNPFSFNITFWDDVHKVLEENYRDNLDDWDAKRIEWWNENISSEEKTIDNYINNKKSLNSKNKKILKKEIQNRKKYHKNLVNIYNQNFDNNYLELIKNNSLLINNLKNELKK